MGAAFPPLHKCRGFYADILMKKKYIDGFSQVHFIAGMVRINMFSYQPQSEGEPIQEDVGQLVMTPQAFVSALNAMQQLADKLAEAGVLQKSEAAAPK